MKTKKLTISMIDEVIHSMALEQCEFTLNGTFRPRKLYKRYFVNLRHLSSNLSISVLRAAEDPEKYYGHFSRYNKSKLHFPSGKNEKYCTLEELLNIHLKDFLKQVYIYDLTTRVN